MLVGLENWPGPEPALPAWQVLVHTSLCATPSATPHPQAAMKVPFASNFCTRALPLSATYTPPGLPRSSVATPTGVWNWPAPEPGLPKLLSGRNSAWAVEAPSATITAHTASATPATRAGSTRTRHQLLATRLPLSALPATKSGTRDGVIEIPPSVGGYGYVVAAGYTGMSVPSLVLALSLSTQILSKKIAPVPEGDARRAGEALG